MLNPPTFQFRTKNKTKLRMDEIKEEKLLDKENKKKKELQQDYPV